MYNHDLTYFVDFWPTHEPQFLLIRWKTVGFCIRIVVAKPVEELSDNTKADNTQEGSLSVFAQHTKTATPLWLLDRFHL